MSLQLLLTKFKEDYENSVENFGGTDPYGPKKSRDLRAVSYEYKTPIKKDTYENSLVQCTEWDNGEGFDFTISHSKGSDNKVFSLHTSELDAILFCVMDILKI